MADDEPAPAFEPDDIPTPVEMAQIARGLLRERAEDDPKLAEKMRARGIIVSRRKSR